MVLALAPFPSLYEEAPYFRKKEWTATNYHYDVKRFLKRIIQLTTLYHFLCHKENTLTLKLLFRLHNAVLLLTTFVI